MDRFFKNFTWGDEGSLDSAKVMKNSSITVSSLDDLSGFVRIADNFLVNKAHNDLWKIDKNAEGDLVICRLFDSEGNPIEV